MTPSIETPRLRVRPFVEADLDAVVALRDDCFGPASRADRLAWFGWAVRNYRALADLRQPPYGDYAVTRRADGTLVGSVGLVPSFGPFGKLPWFRTRRLDGPTNLFTPEMGLFWAVGSGHRRQGYAAEAAAALAAYAFDALRVDRLVATTEHANAASIAVMRRLGMTVETNPDAGPHWFQTVGVLANPAAPPTGG
jgi:RimJ/RimL family protein N-acetyltransferase